jgi:hypothetical protein
MDSYVDPPFFCQDDNERRYAIDTFWLENINFKKKIDCLAFSSLFEVRETANSLYSLALEYNLGDKVKNEFIDKIKFINYLLENLGHGGHSIALQRLKDKFGGKKGMSAKNKKEADKIIREFTCKLCYSSAPSANANAAIFAPSAYALPNGTFQCSPISNGTSTTEYSYERSKWPLLYLSTTWACGKELPQQSE